MSIIFKALDKYSRDRGRGTLMFPESPRNPAEHGINSTLSPVPQFVKSEQGPVDARQSHFEVPPVESETDKTGFDESRVDFRMMALLKPHSLEAEQFRMLATKLLFPLAGKPPRSILVTSAYPAEGKTFVAGNLSVTIALNLGRPVLVIDADLRCPQLHTRFGFDSAPGLSDYLEGRRTLSSLFLGPTVQNLTLLPGGAPPINPSELISSERMANFLDEVTAREGDHLIVIDAPPPGLTAETNVLARQVDGIVIVIHHRKTRKADIYQTIQNFGKQKVLGAIINNMS